MSCTNEQQFGSIILDTSPILTDTPPISTLLAKADKLYTVPSVIDEVKDPNARSRLQVTILPFLTVQIPKAESIKFVTDFAKRTGDYAVLSKTDIQILALAYETDCDRCGGDSRLRKVPAQQPANRPKAQAQKKVQHAKEAPSSAIIVDLKDVERQAVDALPDAGFGDVSYSPDPPVIRNPNELSTNVETLSIVDSGDAITPEHVPGVLKDLLGSNAPAEDAESSGSEGWITPSNLKKHQEKEGMHSTASIREGQVIQVATITGDFAMQNVLLQIGLDILSPSLQRIRNIKSYILRCHACFEKVKDMSKQFCPRCGKPTLTRVSCSTNKKGEFKIHLKKNMQWNHRGDRYSIPKPVSGAANGKVGQGKGGGKGGWGQELILAEDQKEYLRATANRKGRKETDLMDEDYLPSILTGDRGRVGGRPRIGAGRNVNSKKRS